jgi:hypothetical protein
MEFEYRRKLAGSAEWGRISRSAAVDWTSLIAVEDVEQAAKSSRRGVAFRYDSNGELMVVATGRPGTILGNVGYAVGVLGKLVGTANELSGREQVALVREARQYLTNALELLGDA